MADISNKKNILIIFLAILLSTSACFDGKHEQNVIRKILTTYSEAFANNMGSECAKYLDSATINYYSYILTLIKNADSVSIEQMRFDQQFAVLAVRHTASPEKIMNMNGKILFQYLVENGKGGSGGFSSSGYSTKFLSLNKEQARLQLIDSNNKPGIVITFNYENDEWKINLSKLLALTSKQAYETAFKENGTSGREVIYSALEEMNGKKPSNSIWKPLALK